MNRTIVLCWSLVAVLAFVGCSGSRSATPAAKPPPVQAEISVIPPQRLKDDRPYVQFDTSFGASGEIRNSEER